MKILLVEDEKAFGQTLKLSIESFGHTVSWARTLKDARKILEQDPPDALVLDRNLPDGEGLELCQRITQKSGGPFVLILSAKSEVTSRVEGLNAGADDYLGKPFSLQELEARLQAFERRAVVQEISSLWGLRPETLEIQTPNGWFRFTPHEYKFLKFMIQHPGHIISKVRLLREVWGFQLLPKTRTIDYFVNQLRKSIEQDPENPKHLITVRGAGIRFQP